MNRRHRRGRSNDESHKHDLRNDAGQYDVGYDRLCRCGHRKGSHVAGDGRGAYECIVHEVGEGPEANQPPCDCEKFRAKPLPRKKQA